MVNDALLSGAADYIAAGPPAFLTLWDRTRDSIGVTGVAAMTSLPMYLNTHAAHLQTVDDLRDGDKIAVTAIKVSIPALVMQMYAAREVRRGRGDAIRQVHRVDDASRWRGRAAVRRARASPRISPRRRFISASARIRRSARS